MSLRSTKTSLLLISVAMAGAPLPAQTNWALQSRGAATGTYGLDRTGMDFSKQPGDDFYAFANGSWELATTIPDDRSETGVFDTLDAIIVSRVTDELEEARHQTYNKMGALYASFLDVKTTQQRGLRPLLPWISKITRAKDKQTLLRVLAELQRYGVSGLTDVEVTADPEQPETYVVRLHQSGTELPSRDYYLKADAHLASMRAAYLDYLSRMLAASGNSDTSRRAQKVLAFETRLARSQWNEAEKRNADKNYQKWPRSDFAARAPGIDWAIYLRELGLADQKVLVVNEPTALSGASAAWSREPLSVLKDWVLLSLLNEYASYLSPGFSDLRFDFFGRVLAGTTQQTNRQRLAAHQVARLMRDEVGREYAKRYFPEESKVAVQSIVRNIVAAYRTRITETPWLASSTKQEAVAKLDRVRVLIGYPDAWRDYSSLAIKPRDLVGNVQRCKFFESQHELNKLQKPADRGDWLLPVTTTGGWANPVLVQIAFPAGILQSPVFDPGADAAVNYGAIGAVIGHELSHLFDDQGRKYDASGRVAMWWSTDEIKEYSLRTDKLVQQYDSYTPLPGLHLNGEATLGENVADLLGLEVALDGYHLSLQGRPAPFLDNLSGDQRFYLGFAQMQRSKEREAALRRDITADVHSPAEQRVDVIRNLDSWYAAFGVNVGSKLFLPPEKRVFIW